MTTKELLSIDKSKLKDVSKTLNSFDIPYLVTLLNEKDDNVRYTAFLLLQYRSLEYGDVYPFWDIFKEKLKSTNSYQRSIGLQMIAENTRWDADNLIDQTIDDYLMILADEKPITVRQCIQALSKIIPYKDHLLNKISRRLMVIELDCIKETMRKLVLLDILTILAHIIKKVDGTETRKYIEQALLGDLLDKKSKKQIEAMI